MDKKDFNDVALFDKIKSTHLYFYQIAYQEQKPIRSALHWDVPKDFNYALQNHYCVTLIECPFTFNFEALLNHFAWCCRFMFFNFSETTIQFDILKRLREKAISREETLILLKILEENPEPYAYPLDAYEGETKFALIKRHTMDKKGNSREFLSRDKHFRKVLNETLRSLHANINQNQNDTVINTRKYEPSIYGYLRFSDVLTIEQQEKVIEFLFEILKDLFKAEYSYKEFYQLFNNETSKPVELDISKENKSFLDAQKLHLLFRKLKDRILVASWDIIRQKIIVYNQTGDVVTSVYQLSSSKISSDKLRQVNRLLQPVLNLLPEQP
ncbi:hypothetical protein KHS38_20730 [Mucilaginibacter sp. Bleaf8]|uniref:hypothetical protein n=1 Tax=Mucilaginibacter sp. Bleaf8 TaxID=2834430 RepID=UPI001BCAB0F6|nr:hypothetical protein [Mucilaginibacter sp. Bleaf8]MBS7566843.1 hypothetical protein [Mucilaginibacter sp. Bleaf8]